jgi:tetraacyldisaccharide 4'-kinase
MRLSYAYEQMLFHPKWYDWLFVVLLLPLSVLYGAWMLVRRKTATRKRYPVPIVSVGNLIVGGSGKTPFVIALASRYERVAVVSRGYGRKSSGLVEVSRNGKILVDVRQSGDEAMEMAQALPKASVIVSEKREVAIERAMAQGAKMIILDDGFNRVEIEKYEIILEPECVANPFPFPAGPYREFAFCKRAADIVAKEGKDFWRKVVYEDLQERMLLVTAISDPERLDAYLPKGVVQKVYLPDHAYFDEKELARLMAECDAQSLLVTGKDAVKMADFKLPLSKMKLKLEIKPTIIQQIETYIEGYRREE